MLDNYARSEKTEYKKNSLAHRLWYEITPSIYNFINFLQMYDYHYKINKLNRRNFDKKRHFCDTNVSILYVKNNPRSKNTHTV